MSKFRTSSKDQRTADGIVFHSKLEMNRYLFLKELERAGAITDLVIQPRFAWHVTCQPEDTSMEAEYHATESYYADFRYTIVQNNEDVIEDVKGVRTSTYKRKKKIVEALFGIKITEVTQVI